MRFAYLLLLLVPAPSAFAQTAYFFEEQSVFGVQGFRQHYPYQDDGDDESSYLLGGEMVIPISSRASLSLGGAGTPDLGGQVKVRTATVGISYFAARQSADEVLTAEVGFGAGYVGGERVPSGPAVTVGVEFSRAVAHRAPVFFVPSIRGAATFLFLGEYDGVGGGSSVQSVSLGLGIGIALAEPVVLFIEPGLTFTFSEGDQPAVFGLSVGLGYGY